ncbi:DUF6207 family protein [Streptomyces sp. NPDC005195]
MRCGRWATATAGRTTRDTGQPGVRLRCSDTESGPRLGAGLRRSRRASVS